MPRRLATIDLGTNTVRYLLVEVDGTTPWRVIDQDQRVTRLGEGLAASGRLGEAPMTRTADAVRVYVERARRLDASEVRVVATSAVREAANGRAFGDRVQTSTGIPVTIVSGEDEARLTIRGVLAGLRSLTGSLLVFDIGGGSTELGWLRLRSGRPPQILDTLSIPFGVVNLTERYGGSRIAPEVYDAMVAEVAANLRHFAEANGINQRVAAGAVQMLGTSGTVTTLAGVHLGLERYNRALIDGCYLDFPSIRAVSRQLAAMTCEERTASPCIGPERADLVVAGCAILEAICGLWPVGRLRVADRGVREGILVELMQG